jgi:hypothetical protein
LSSFAELPREPLPLPYASNDARINAGIPYFDVALAATRKTWENSPIQAAGHGFNNDLGQGYHREAAQLA